MAGFIFLGIGLLCAIIGRILLIGAAFGVSIWWGLGVFLPFGPLFFRISYPDLARGSKIFRIATVPCLLLYLVCGPGLNQTAYYRYRIKRTPPPDTTGYAMEPPIKKANGPQVQLGPSLAERRAANAAEFERLRLWSEKLRLQKRDLLHSDSDGNRAYDRELSDYNAALERAIVEQATLDQLTK